MQKQFFIKCMVAWMIVWLPVAGGIASTMPIASFADLPGLAVASAPSISLEAAKDSVATSMPCHASDSSGPNVDGKPCSHCVLCHLAGAIVPPTVPTMPLNTRHDSPKSIDSVSFTSFIAELPQRPPSRSRA